MIDWNNKNGPNETSVQANINNFPQWKYNSNPSEILHGFDDWLNLFFYFVNSGSFAGGFEFVDVTDIEMTLEIAEAMEEDAKNMEGGPTGPVQTTDTPTQPSPEEEDSDSQTTNPFFLFFDRALSFAKSNPILIGAAAAGVISLIVVSSLVKRKRKQKTSQTALPKS
jgi:hypothetical protein